MENKKTCKEVIREKVALIEATSIMPEEVFNRLLNHLLLYCELGLDLKECWVDGMNMFNIKSYKDQRYYEFKRVFNLLKKVISKQCNCFETEENNDWNSKSNEW